MKSRFKKITLSLAIVSVLLSVANGNAGESAKTGVHSVGKHGHKAPKTQLVSVNSAGTSGGNGQSSQPKLSANGRFVAFYSLASDLVANDTNSLGDIFVRDLKAGTTKLATINLLGASSIYYLSDAPEDQLFDIPVPELSANGRFVAFHSNADDLVVNKIDGYSGIYVRDLKRSKTAWVSPGGNNYYFPKLSANGCYVAFMSFAQVYVHSCKTGRTTLVTVNLTGTESQYFGDDDPLSRPVISADGRFVAFRTYAGDLVPNDFNGSLDNAFSGAAGDVFVRDLKTAKTILVSVNRSGVAGGFSFGPILSNNGRFVAFNSEASDLVANDTNGTTDAFIRDLKSRTTTLVSINNAGTDSGNNLSIPTGLSADGRFVAFLSFASDLVANDNNGAADIFVRDLKTRTTMLASEFYAKPGRDKLIPRPEVSENGRVAAFVSGKDIFVRLTGRNN